MGLRLSKNPSGFSDKLLQSAARTPCAPEAHNSHTCSLSCIFCQVHAPAENDPHIICCLRQQTLRGLFDKLNPTGNFACGIFVPFVQRITWDWLGCAGCLGKQKTTLSIGLPILRAVIHFSYPASSIRPHFLQNGYLFSISVSYMIIGLTPFLYLHDTRKTNNSQDGICHKNAGAFLCNGENDSLSGSFRLTPDLCCAILISLGLFV